MFHLGATVPGEATSAFSHWRACVAVEQWEIRKLYCLNNQMTPQVTSGFLPVISTPFLKIFSCRLRSFFQLTQGNLDSPLKVNITGFFSNADLDKKFANLKVENVTGSKPDSHAPTSRVQRPATLSLRFHALMTSLMTSQGHKVGQILKLTYLRQFMS